MTQNHIFRKSNIQVQAKALDQKGLVVVMYNLRTREAAINNDNNTSDCENTALGSQFQPGIFFIGCSGAGTLQLDTPQTKLEHFAPLNENAFFVNRIKGVSFIVAERQEWYLVICLRLFTTIGREQTIINTRIGSNINQPKKNLRSHSISVLKF